MKSINSPLEIFLLIGQSNMAGRGPLNTVPPLRHPNSRMFRNGQWIPAEEPLHTDKPAMAGVGLGMSFTVTLLDRRPDAVIGLLPCAVGGTPLHRWMPAADLYANAVAVARKARTSGMLKGILWHQGEADCQHEEDAASYGRRLSEMIGALRADIGAPDIPFIAGELGEFLKNHAACRVFFRMVNAQLHALHGSVARFGCVSASGLTDRGDHVHFDSASLREFGRRYANEYLRVITEERIK